MTSPTTAPDWEAFLTDHPETHLLQTAPWGTLKREFGWDVEKVLSAGCGAQVLFRRLPLGLTLAYVPKGPVGNWLPNLLPSLDSLCRKRQAFALKVEPDGSWDSSLGVELQSHGFLPSPHGIQPARTLIVDLDRSEDQILASMSQKTRYNVRLAARKGVTVRPWNNLPAFAEMMAETAERDHFGVHSEAYYSLAYELFHPQGQCELLVAERDGAPLAAIMAFARGQRAWYFYGASTAIDRNLMPTYLLQWEAMRWAQQRGCIQYDLWGVPDESLDDLEAGFSSRNDGLWGVYRFKRGFGGRLVRSAGTWDRPYKLGLYRAYRWISSRRSIG